MAGVGEEFRGRIAAILVGVGCLLIVVGLYFAFQQQRDIAAGSGIVPGSVPRETVATARAIQVVLVGALVLVGIFAIASLAFLRWSRHYRRRLLRQPAPPTPSDDVWAMHQVPDPDTSQDPADESP